MGVYGLATHQPAGTTLPPLADSVPVTPLWSEPSSVGESIPTMKAFVMEEEEEARPLLPSAVGPV